MLRVVAILVAFTSAAVAQATKQEQSSLSEQFVAESFKIEATAVATQFNFWWNTTVSYTITNNSGMNLYAGFLTNSVAIGSCTDPETVRGALQLLPAPAATAWRTDSSIGTPSGAFLPPGARASGTLIFAHCAAPNPGFETAPLSITLMVGREQSFRTMAQFPLSIDAPVRQLKSY